MVLFQSWKPGRLRDQTLFEKTIGGAESNVAIALARLGHRVGWFSRLGDDPFGQYILQRIRGEGVDTSRVIIDRHAPTGIYFKETIGSEEPRMYYYRRHSAASRLSIADLDEKYIAGAQFLHVSGITPALSESARELVFHAIDVAKRAGTKITFDPNIRLKLWDIDVARPVLLDIARRADYVLPGLEEARLLVGGRPVLEVIRRLQSEGVSRVIVKAGAEGAYTMAPEGETLVHVPAFPFAQVVDPTGAGDGFAAGFISGLLKGKSLEEAIRRGHMVGAKAVAVHGDIDGYPYEHELEDLEKGNVPILR